MSDGDTGTDPGLTPPTGSMDDAEILDIGLFSDEDASLVSAKDATRPDPDMGRELDFTDDGGGGVNPGGGVNDGVMDRPGLDHGQICNAPM